MDKTEEGKTTQEHGEFGEEKGLSVKLREHAFVVGTTGVTACAEVACSSIGHRKGHPPELHLDCDRSDLETVSSPIHSKGLEEAREKPYAGPFRCAIKCFSLSEDFLSPVAFSINSLQTDKSLSIGPDTLYRSSYSPQSKPFRGEPAAKRRTLSRCIPHASLPEYLQRTKREPGGDEGEELFSSAGSSIIPVTPNRQKESSRGNLPSVSSGKRGEVEGGKEGRAMTGMAAGKHRHRDREEREEMAYQSPSVCSGRRCHRRPTGGAAKRQK
ncbi:hypothetical protein Q8A73_017587 [Channa argus]|nr:hypothetical protein Q8A73_017587 [Channa argus]